MIFPLFLTIVALTFLLCFLCGAAWSTNRRIPFIAATVIVGVYVVFAGALGIWAAQCWQCGTGDFESTRALNFFWSVGFGWIPPALLFGTVLIGMTASLYLDAAAKARRWQNQRHEMKLHLSAADPRTP